MFIHLTAQTVVRTPHLSEASSLEWLWVRLRSNFPSALAACLMSTHLHLIVPARRAARTTLARLLGAFARVFGHHHLWRRVCVSSVEEPLKLQRGCRYLHLNPVRAGLVADPLEWSWSTHRGVIGAEADPWVDAGRVARALGRPERGFVEWFHRYVSSDPSVHVTGSPLPNVAVPSARAKLPLHEVLSAATSATRWLPGPRQRRAAIQLAYKLGWRHVEQLAEVVGCSVHTVHRALKAPETDLAPALVCAGDSRLR